MAVLIQEELQRRDAALREALFGGMTMPDLEEDRWGPLDATLGRIRGW